MRTPSLILRDTRSSVKIPENGRLREATADVIPPWVVGPCGEPPVPASGDDGLGPPRGGVPPGLAGAAAARARAPPYGRKGPWAVNQASSAVSAMRALRPRCTTGSSPVHSSRANVSGLTPNHRCASSRGISWGGGGSSRGRSSWRADGRRLGRRCGDGAAMAGTSPRRAGRAMPWTETVDSPKRSGPRPGRQDERSMLRFLS
jgi:hypothetical protein